MSDPGRGDTGSADCPPRLLRSAVLYARRGVPVFPCEPGGGAPLPKCGPGEATTDEGQIGRWWRRRPLANVGVPTGAASGLVVLEVGRGGAAEIADLEFAHGRPRTARAAAGDGREHAYFLRPSFAELRAAGVEEAAMYGRDRLGMGLTVLGEGSHVLAPPSRTLSGEHRWVDLAAPAPSSWLLRCVRGMAEREPEREPERVDGRERGKPGEAPRAGSIWAPRVHAEETRKGAAVIHYDWEMMALAADWGRGPWSYREDEDAFFYPDGAFAFSKTEIAVGTLVERGDWEGPTPEEVERGPALGPGE